MTEYRDWTGKVGDVWAQEWRRTDRSFGELTPRLLAAARGEAFTRALDIGCGAGEISCALAERDPAVPVMGVDISPELLAVARERGAGLGNLDFVLGDAAQLACGTADLLVSRHGVMFFADPVAAFTHLREHAGDKARLVFSCFRSREDNAWTAATMAALPSVPPPPDPHEPGPFAFADKDRVAGILSQAGWTDIAFDPVDYGMVLGSGADPVADARSYLTRVGPTASALAALDDDTERAAALARLTPILDQARDGECGDHARSGVDRHCTEPLRNNDGRRSLSQSCPHPHPHPCPSSSTHRAAPPAARAMAFAASWRPPLRKRASRSSSNWWRARTSTPRSSATAPRRVSRWAAAMGRSAVPRDKLAEWGTEFAVLPLGTRNHFARQLDIPLDLEGAARVAAQGAVEAVDIGDAGGRTFLNNASLGAYVELVEAREDSGLPKAIGSAVAGVRVLRKLRARRYDLTLDGEPRPVRTVQLFIGNNRYQISEGAPGDRPSLRGRSALGLRYRAAVAPRADPHRLPRGARQARHEAGLRARRNRASGW